MSTRVLVAYSSKYGATQGIAEKIGAVLSEAGLQADVQAVRRVRDVTPYQAVILGSAVYMFKWRADSARFLKAHEAALASKPTWLFSSGPIGEGSPAEIAEGLRFPQQQQAIADRIRPRDIAVFHGAIDVTRLNPFYRWIITKINSPVGDFRDWNAITAWALAIAAELKGAG
jgi:menaquinone-dependent protoporphyrinogen oxidase